MQRQDIEGSRNTMDTVQVKIPRWIGGYGVNPAAWSTSEVAVVKPAPLIAPKTFQLSADERVRFMRIVSECGRIQRHYDIYRWLSGDMQHFLPHQILLSAWGDFANWNLKLDLTSGLPGVRTVQLAHC